MDASFGFFSLYLGRTLNSGFKEAGVCLGLFLENCGRKEKDTKIRKHLQLVNLKTTCNPQLGILHVSCLIPSFSP